MTGGRLSVGRLLAGATGWNWFARCWKCLVHQGADRQIAQSDGLQPGLWRSGASIAFMLSCFFKFSEIITVCMAVSRLIQISLRKIVMLTFGAESWCSFRNFAGNKKKREKKSCLRWNEGNYLIFCPDPATVGCIAHLVRIQGSKARPVHFELLSCGLHHW